MTAGLLDTSVVVDWHDPAVIAALPDQVTISAITVAELAAGPHEASSPLEAGRRQTRLREVEAKSEPLAFDGAAVRSYGLVVAAVGREGRRPRSRFADLLIAATRTPTAWISTPATPWTSLAWPTSSRSSRSEVSTADTPL